MTVARYGMILVRRETAELFWCKRCDKQKKAKNMATVVATGDTLCNGCYGFLLAEAENPNDDKE